MTTHLSGRASRVLVPLLCALAAAFAHAADEAPDAFIKRMSEEVIAAARADKAIQAGDTARTIALVDSKIMPNVDFQRMTAGAVGPAWRPATPEQRARLEREFETLLVRTYAGALGEVKDRTISMRPLRMAEGDRDVVVRSEVRGRGDPIELAYRWERMPGQGAGWRIYNLNVLGIWLVETYRNQFAPEINAHGIDGLIESLSQRNKANAGKG